MNNGLRPTLLAAAASLVLSSTAFAVEPGPYAGFGIGLHMPASSTAEAQIPAGTAPVDFKSEFRTGVIGVGSVGYKWDKGYRTELEVGYRKAEFDTINGRPATGAQKVFGVLANMLYDFDINSPFTPYLGAGLGLGANKWGNVTTTMSTTFNDRRTAFQWQGMTGINMQITRRVDAFIDYRYIGTKKYRFRSQPAGSVIGGVNDRSSNVMIGLRIGLGRTMLTSANEQRG